MSGGGTGGSVGETSVAFVRALERAGYDWYTGVPCSLLKGPIRLLEEQARFPWLPAVREDAAVGAAVGAWLGGRKPVVLMQNSGFTVCYNALASLSILYRIPALLVTSWRGHGPDAPEHILTGATTEDVFRVLGIPYAVLDPAQIETQVADATAVVDEQRLPAGLLVREGILA